MPQKKSKRNQGSLAHELNNLLTAISLSAEVLLAEIDGPLATSQKKYAKDILASAKKMQAVIKRLP